MEVLPHPHLTEEEGRIKLKLLAVIESQVLRRRNSSQKGLAHLSPKNVMPIE
jgi:hypothetical protein